MNQKDYEEITKIINRNILKTTNINEIYTIGSLANDLADYFEKEQEEALQDDPYPLNREPFDKQQFLKDCGVKDKNYSKDYSDKYECKKCGAMVNNEWRCSCENRTNGVK